METKLDDALPFFTAARELFTSLNDDSYEFRQIKNKNHRIISDLEELIAFCACNGGNKLPEMDVCGECL